MKKLFLPLALATAYVAQAAPLSDLSNGQTGRIEFQSTTPADPWAMIRNVRERTTPAVVWGDLSIPENVSEKVRVAVLGHGSDGVASSTIGVYVKALNQAGIATFVVDSYNPRRFVQHTVLTRNEQNATANISDSMHALKLLATHPKIDPEKIFFIGWSTGGRSALYGAFPAYLRAVVPAPLKYAGSVGLYPSGCTSRIRVEHLGTNPAPLHLILAEKDDVTPPKPCAKFADELKAAGHKVTYVTYPNTYHAFDRLDQRWMKLKDAQGRNCDLEVIIPEGRGMGKGYDFVQKKPIHSGAELYAALKACSSVDWITVETNSKARDRAVKEVIDFIQTN